MIMGVFSVFDRAAGAYLRPFFFPRPGEAVRAFQDLVNDDTTQFHRHAEDYVLFHIGDYDDSTGVLTSKEILSVLAKGHELKVDGAL